MALKRNICSWETETHAAFSIRRGGDSVFSLASCSLRKPASSPYGAIVAPFPPVGRRGLGLNPSLSTLRLQQPILNTSCSFSIRRGGDSNPRYPCGAQLLSREPDSASLAPLLNKNCQLSRPFTASLRSRGDSVFLSDLVSSKKPASVPLRRHRGASSSLWSAGTPVRIPPASKVYFKNAQNLTTIPVFCSVLTEQGGFEPPVPFGTTVFKTASLNRSDTAPTRGTEY